jgi:hypothetical protein
MVMHADVWVVQGLFIVTQSGRDTFGQSVRHKKLSGLAQPLPMQYIVYSQIIP